MPDNEHAQFRAEVGDTQRKPGAAYMPHICRGRLRKKITVARPPDQGSRSGGVDALVMLRRLTPIWGLISVCIAALALALYSQQVTALDAVLVIGVIALLGLCLWRIPEELATERKHESPEHAKSRVERESSARNSIGQLMAGAAAVVGIYFLWGQLVATNATLETTQRGQVAERFTRAVDQLGSESGATRLGGIFALEQIAGDPEQVWPVVQVLTAQIREISPWPPSPLADTREREHLSERNEMLSVLARLSHRLSGGSEVLELTATDLRSVDFESAHLNGADFRGANLREARFAGVNLVGADFRPVDGVVTRLSGATFLDADLTDALMRCADLSGSSTILTGATLIGTNLAGARLSEANLAGAKLQGAVLNEADLRGVNFGRAKMDQRTTLDGAYLQGAILRDVTGLTSDQLELACTDEMTRLPDNVRPGTGASCQNLPPPSCDPDGPGGESSVSAGVADASTVEGSEEAPLTQ